ncbi:MAG: Hpt domain-containing protein [Deltaproteobacteria bacterium]|nr:Hpt domain-containing protein [Deltaproteobacteria bacterium]
MDDKGFLKDLLYEFIHDMPAQLTTLRADIEKRDLEALRQDAHRLKGSSRTITANAMADVAYALEMMGKNDDLSGAESALKRLKGEMDRLKDFVENHGWDQSDAG